ncbi:MAG: hypothetical protein ABSD71_14230 [Bacteroidales bacterium]|jgi:hypothetical protein
MKELEALVIKLNETLNKKEKELSSQERYDAHTQGHLKNKKDEIIAFKNSIQNLSKDPYLRKQIIDNYTKVAIRIIKDIENI